MDKQHILNAIKEGVEKGTITDAEVRGAVSAASKSASSRNGLIVKVLYGIGGFIALVGVLILLAQYWDDLGSFFKIFVTLGLALITYVSAIIVSRKPETGTLSQVLFTVSAVLAPIGSLIAADEFSIAWDRPLLHAIVMTSLALCFAAALYATRKPILHVVAGFYVAWAYFATITQMLKGSAFIVSDIMDIFAYAGMILGVAYFLYASWLRKKADQSPEKSLSRVSGAYMFSAFFFFLVGGLFLSGKTVALSVSLRTTAGLLVSVFSIGAYLIKISVKYFSDTLGFAFLLVILGFVFMGLGYLTYYLNKNYISK